MDIPPTGVPRLRPVCRLPLCSQSYNCTKLSFSPCFLLMETRRPRPGVRNSVFTSCLSSGKSRRVVGADGLVSGISQSVSWFSPMLVGLPVQADLDLIANVSKISLVLRHPALDVVRNQSLD